MASHSQHLDVLLTQLRFKDKARVKGERLSLTHSLTHSLFYAHQIQVLVNHSHSLTPSLICVVVSCIVCSGFGGAGQTLQVTGAQDWSAR
jgi:hypothetical protein